MGNVWTLRRALGQPRHDVRRLVQSGGTKLDLVSKTSPPITRSLQRTHRRCLEGVDGARGEVVANIA